MESIKIEVTGNIARVTEKPQRITAGTVGLPIEFTFDGQWDGLSKTAVFRVRHTKKIVERLETEATVPWELLEKPGAWLSVGVYGINEDGSVAIPTVWANVAVIKEGADPDGDPGIDPELPVWQKLLNDVGDLQDLNTEDKGDLVEAINEAHRIALAGGVNTDTTLSQSGRAADAKATGEALQGVRNSVTQTQQSVNAAQQSANSAQQSADAKLPLSGGKMTGSIDMDGNAITGLATPESSSEAATKEYVDSKCKSIPGLIYPLASADVPDGFLLCDGAAYSRTAYRELFNVIGTVYGEGDGRTTFNVPNLSKKVPVGAGDGEGYGLGDTGGADKVTLSVNEIPNHEHSVRQVHTGGNYSGLSLTHTSKLDTSGGNADGYYVTLGNGMQTSPVGGGESHENMPPYTVVQYIISTGKGDTISYAVARTAGEGGEGTFDHSALINRDLPGQHPMSAIEGLEETLGDIESALDGILAIQNELIGGDET